jgi:FixJ family two-component response regulator
MTGAYRHTIAVVDDDYRILESLESLLESAGHSVRVFPSAEAFLEAGVLANVDCLISDIGLPGIDGYGLLRSIQSNRPELPVFLITGREEMARTQPEPFVRPNHFFVKPFDGKKLLNEVAEALKRASVQSEK